MLRLRVKAPFATFRPFTAGSYRPTAPFLTPSAAYGLVLNVAAIESRYNDGRSPMTLMAEDLPPAEIAIGAISLPERQALYPDGPQDWKHRETSAISLPERQALYQQLHNYPVGATGKSRAGETKGNKYNIQPVWREFLSDLDAYVCVRDNDALEARIREGLRLGCQFAPEGKRRYGVPFLGDNSFLLSVLREECEAVPAFWFVRAGGKTYDAGGDLCRLTVWIDRRDMSRTVAHLYAPLTQPAIEPPDDAWTRIPAMGPPP